MGQRRIPIPGKYFAKLLIEFILLSMVAFLYSVGHTWLDNYPLMGGVALAILKFLIFLFGASLIARLLAMIYRGSKHLPYHKKDNVTLGLSNLFYLIIVVYAIISLLTLLGFSPGRMFTSLSIMAAAFAILSKDFIADIISGMIISFSSEVSIDDYVKIGDHRGRIIDINIAKIALLNEDDDIIFIPNGKVFSSEIINYTKKQIKKTSIDFEIPAGSISSIDELEVQLIQSLAEYHHLIEPGSFFLRVLEIKKDYIAVKFQYSLIQFNRETERLIKRKAVRHIVKLIAISKGKDTPGRH